MAKSEDEFLAYCVDMMRKGGLWVETRSDAGRALLTLSGLTLFLLLSVKAVDASDLERFSTVGVTLANVFLCLGKASLLTLRGARVRWLVLDARRRSSLLAATSPAHAALLWSRELLLRRVTRLVFIFGGSVMLAWMLAPLLHVVGVLSSERLDLPIQMWFPWDTSTRAPFLAAVLLELGVATLLVPAYVMINTFHVALVMSTCAQLRVLCSMLAAAAEDSSGVAHHHRHWRRLCVQVHCSILRFGKELEDFMSPLMLLQFSVNVAGICQTFIQISKSPTVDEHSVKFAGYLSVLLLELWLYCYFGSLLIDASCEVEMAAYSSPWYEQRGSKDLVLTILRAQRPLRLVVGKIVVVSLDTFMQVIKFSYSMFTFLTQLNAKDHQPVNIKTLD